MKGTHHVIAHSTCSQSSVERGNPFGEASKGEPVSRSASEPVSASLKVKELASPPYRMKPDDTGDEAMGRCSRRSSRGERGQRAGKDQPRNLGDPAGELESKDEATASGNK